jgi:hypothetical protein
LVLQVKGLCLGSEPEEVGTHPASSILIKMQCNKITSRTVKPVSQRSSVLCRAVINDNVTDVTAARRSVMSIFVAYISSIALPSYALIPVSTKSYPRVLLIADEG